MFPVINDKNGMYSILINTPSQVYVIHKLYDDGELAKTCRIYADESLFLEGNASIADEFRGFDNFVSIKTMRKCISYLFRPDEKRPM